MNPEIFEDCKKQKDHDAFTGILVFLGDDQWNKFQALTRKLKIPFRVIDVTLKYIEIGILSDDLETIEDELGTFERA